MRKLSTPKKFSRGRASRGFGPILKAKKRPRGKPFAKGHAVGKEFRFKKGAPSPNPGGRPASKEVSRASREWLAAPVTADELRANRLPLELLGHSHAECIAVIQGQDALRGSLPSAEFVADRAEGKPHTSMSVDAQANPLTELVASMAEISRQIGPPPEPDAGPEEDNE